MKRHSLRAVLARQWISFGVLLFAGFAGMAVLLLFLLEDQFIDRRLRDVGEAISASAVDLPAGFTLLAWDQAPATLQGAFGSHRPGAIRETRLADGRYVHVLALRDRTGTDLLLAYDVSDQLYVNAALRSGWPWLLAIATLLALTAWLLAHRFVGALARRADALVRGLGDAHGTATLRRIAEDEPIEEFALLARRSAEAWDAREAALARERETLAFLGHELRTPLQSARTSLDALREDRHNAAAWQRLHRAHQRLARASQAILWLDRGAVTAANHSNPLPAAALLSALAEEFAPLAQQRQQSIQLHAAPGFSWPWPLEVIETITANLLMNAIQHGGAGCVEVRADEHGLVVLNPRGDHAGSGGFGLGLELVARLAQRFGGALDRRERGPDVLVRVSFRAGAAV